MNIGILTWYKALNHGAVLQAYATQHVLYDNGYMSYLMNYDREISDERPFADQMRAKLKKLSLRYLFERKKIFEMNKEKQQAFDAFISQCLSVKEDWKDETFDAVIIGSDMVFNLKQGYVPYMFGYGVNSTKIFSYAASAGGTTIELAEKLKVRNEISKALNAFSAIGCRDASTKQFVSSISKRKDLADNIDPVLLYGFEKERKEWETGKWKVHSPYILIYGYHGSMEQKHETAAVKKFAKERNLKIVSCGYYHSWCDEIVNCSPKEFIEMFSNAAYVATDTFHGTVFSLIFERPFVSIVRDNSFKLEYLLKQAQLKDRIAASPKEIYDILGKDVLWDFKRAWLEDARKASQRFLLGNL